jgi:hypothetical protein
MRFWNFVLESIMRFTQENAMSFLIFEMYIGLVLFLFLLSGSDNFNSFKNAIVEF